VDATDQTAAREILDRAMVARLASVSRSGRPHVNPIYFVPRGDRILLGTTMGTLAARNVAANPAVQILLEVEADPEDARVLRIDGTATLRSEPAILRAYKRMDARKYFRSWRGLWMALTHPRRLMLTRRYLSAAGPGSAHCVIEVEPMSFEILTTPR
jgi:general stress protein 26